MGVEAGSISVAATGRLLVRVGADLDADFSAPRAGAPGGSLSRTPQAGWSGYAFASANGRYQAYDIFFDEVAGEDGDPDRAGSAISRSTTRTESSFGVVIASGGARTLDLTGESKRYDQQAGRQKYGEVTLGWAF